MKVKKTLKVAFSVLAVTVCLCAAGAANAADEKKPNILFIMGRHRLDAAEHLPLRPDGRGNAQHRPHRA